MTTKIFIHGLESSNRGTKSVFFRKKFPDMIIPTFTGPLQERMTKLHGILSDQKNIFIVGSSFGGLMGTLFTLENENRVKKLILLAPAIHLVKFGSGADKKITIPVCIYHGKDDDVISLFDITPVARRMFLNLTFNAVDDDHFLHKTFKCIQWDQILG